MKNPFNLKRWFRLLGQQRAIKQEIDDELQFHIEMRTQENIAAGMSPEEAARAARKRFGNVQTVREECRDLTGANFGETLVQDVRFGARMLLKNLGFTITALVTIGLSISATTVIYSFLHTIVLRSLPYDSPERIVRVGAHYKGERKKSSGGMSRADFADWQEQSKCFSFLTYYYIPTLFNFGHEANVSRVQVTRVLTNFFDVFGVNALQGRTFLSEENDPGRKYVAVVSHRFWKGTLGGATNLVGSEILLEGKKHLLVGIMPPQFDYPAKADVWTPLSEDPRGVNREGTAWRLAIGRLRPGVTTDEAQIEMSAIAGRLEQQYPGTNKGRGVAVVNLHEELVQNIRPFLYLLLAAAAVVLLIACANVANLLLARSVAREREMVVRSALGAARGRIVRQLLTESVLLSLMGGLLGVVLAYWGIELVRILAPPKIPMLDEVKLDLPVLGIALGVSVITGILFGIVPALHSYAADLTEALKGRSSAGSKRHMARNALVVSQVALSALLLIGAGLLINSLIRMQQVNSGFELEKVVAVQLHPSSRANQREFYQRLMERVAGVTGDRSVAVTRFLPMAGGAPRFWVDTKGNTPDDAGPFPYVPLNFVSADYFEVMGLGLLRGRTFEQQDNADGELVAVINQSFAKRWFPADDPIGKQIRIEPGKKLSRIVGLVPDARHHSVTLPPEPALYVSYTQGNIGEDPALVVRTTGDVAAVEGIVRNATKEIDPAVPVSKAFKLQEVLARSLATARFQGLLMAWLAGLAVTLAAIGIYGVLAYTVTQRTSELGIRMALGAQRSNVRALVLRQGMKLAAMGVIVGVVAALPLTRLLRSMLFEVTPTDPLIFAGVSVLLLGIALLACWIPARRATKIDPMVALRYE